MTARKTTTRKAHRRILFNGDRWNVTFDSKTLTFRKFRTRRRYRLSLEDLCAAASGQLHLNDVGGAAQPPPANEPPLKAATSPSSWPYF